MKKERSINEAIPPLSKIVLEAIKKYNSMESWLLGGEMRPYLAFNAADDVLEELTRSGIDIQDIFIDVARQTTISLKGFEKNAFASSYNTANELIFAMAEDIVCFEMSQKNPQVKKEDDHRMEKYYF